MTHLLSSYHLTISKSTIEINDCQCITIDHSFEFFIFKLLLNNLENEHGGPFWKQNLFFIIICRVSIAIHSKSIKNGIVLYADHKDYRNHSWSLWLSKAHGNVEFFWSRGEPRNLNISWLFMISFIYEMSLKVLHPFDADVVSPDVNPLF